jgi:hypothetical protein
MVRLVRRRGTERSVRTGVQEEEEAGLPPLHGEPPEAGMERTHGGGTTSRTASMEKQDEEAEKEDEEELFEDQASSR